MSQDEFWLFHCVLHQKHLLFRNAVAQVVIDAIKRRYLVLRQFKVEYVKVFTDP